MTLSNCFKSRVLIVLKLLLILEMLFPEVSLGKLMKRGVVFWACQSRSHLHAVLVFCAAGGIRDIFSFDHSVRQCPDVVHWSR